MINTKFEAYKLTRELKRSGKVYTFRRYIKDEFGEPSGEPVVIGSILGLFHKYVANTSVSLINVTNDIQIRKKDTNMLLCLYEDVAKLSLEVDDIVQIGTSTMKLVKVDNIQDWDIIADMYFEEVDNGTIV